MKRYLAFYGDIYYPLGGMRDFIGDYDSIDEAISAVKEKNKSEWSGTEDWDVIWANIYDSVDETFIFER